MQLLAHQFSFLVNMKTLPRLQEHEDSFQTNGKTVKHFFTYRGSLQGRIICQLKHFNIEVITNLEKSCQYK